MRNFLERCGARPVSANTGACLGFCELIYDCRGHGGNRSLALGALPGSCWKWFVGGPPGSGQLNVMGLWILSFIHMLTVLHPGTRVGTQGTQFASSLMGHACWTTQEKLSIAGSSQALTNAGREMVPNTLVSMAMGITSSASDEPGTTEPVWLTEGQVWEAFWQHFEVS